MLEGIALGLQDNPDWTLEMNGALALSTAGSILLFQTYPAGTKGTPAFQQQVDFALGCYLLVRGDYSYIDLRGGGQTNNDGMYYYPEYDALNNDLGSPISVPPSDISSLESSGIYQRSFQNGIVLVNASGSTVNVALAQSYNPLTCTGGGEVESADFDPSTFAYLGGNCAQQSSVTSVSLAAWSATFLINP